MMSNERDRPSPGLLLRDRLCDRRLELAAAAVAKGDDSLVEIRTADGAVLLDACVAAAVSPLLRESLYFGTEMYRTSFTMTPRMTLVMGIGISVTMWVGRPLVPKVL